MSGKKGKGAWGLAAGDVVGQTTYGLFTDDPGRALHPIESTFGTKYKGTEAPNPGNDPFADAAKKAEADEEVRKRLRLQERGGRASTVLSGAADSETSSTRRTLFAE